MTPEQFAESREREETAILRDPHIQALGYCPSIQRSAVWVFGILKCLEQMAKLPTGPTRVSKIDKKVRLRMLVKSLFLYLAAPGESEFLRGHEHPMEALAHNEKASPVAIGPIEGESIAEAVVIMGRSVLYSLHVAQGPGKIPGIKRITSTTVEYLEPLIGTGEDRRIVSWLRRELDSVLLTSQFGRLQSEFRDAGRIVSGVSLERNLEIHRKQGHLIQVLEPVGTLQEYARHILLAMFLLMDASPKGVKQSTVLFVLGLIQIKAGLPRNNSKPNYAKRLPGLETLGYIARPKGRRNHLTAKGILWVQDSGLTSNYKLVKVKGVYRLL